MSREIYTNSTINVSRRAARGWPVVATGLRPIPDLAAYRRLRVLLDLPEESDDFSFFDAFDMAALMLRRARELELEAAAPELRDVRRVKKQRRAAPRGLNATMSSSC